ncbi:hypothetical protein, partial [Paenibacillus sp. GCM10023250]|uniref:hypothetical protein n=1 Tax=Paenibacillus sp. GCM10023250 TaxID=3252648 RepID=UPI0036152FEC
RRLCAGGRGGFAPAGAAALRRRRGGLAAGCGQHRSTQRFDSVGHASRHRACGTAWIRRTADPGSGSGRLFAGLLLNAGQERRYRALFRAISDRAATRSAICDFRAQYWRNYGQ